MTQPRIPRKDRNRWLVVEGDDDKWVTIELLAKHGEFWGDADREASADLPYVHSANGIDPLRNLVAVELKHKHRHRLGVILDADVEEAGVAWSKVRDRLRRIGDPPEWLSPMLAQLPDSLPKEGLVVEQDERALGVWVMPDNGARGALEDFLVDLVPSGDIHWQPACESVAAAMQRGVLFPPQYRAKAEVHTWLAWQKEPGVPFGRALRSAYFFHDSAGARVFVDWFSACVSWRWVGSAYHPSATTDKATARKSLEHLGLPADTVTVCGSCRLRTARASPFARALRSFSRRASRVKSSIAAGIADT